MTDELKALADLLPCPFCGSAEPLQAFTQATGDFAFWSVECQGCGVEVADSDSQDEANHHWNTRANLPAIRLTSSADLRSKLDVAREFCASLARLTDTECDFIRGVGMYEDGVALRAAARKALANIGGNNEQG